MIVTDENQKPGIESCVFDINNDSEISDSFYFSNNL